MNKLIIGTRGSNLALAQAREVQQKLQNIHPQLEVELKIIKTKGDKRLDLSLDASGDKGLFTRELELALERGEIDCAVHSLKDLPIEATEGTYISCVLPRVNPADVLLGKYSFDKLPHGAVVGTSSPRRAAQLLEQRPDLNIKEIRGNVETRIAKLESGEYDALVMAHAGLERLGLEHQISYVFTFHEMVPAPGQGAIAVQQLTSRPDIATYLEPIHCPHTARCTEIERHILQRLGGGCAMPVGCVCEAVEATDFTTTPHTIVRGYFISLYNLHDDEQTLKGVIVSPESSNDEIWQSLQEKTVPLRRERFS